MLAATYLSPGTVVSDISILAWQSIVPCTSRLAVSVMLTLIPSLARAQARAGWPARAVVIRHPAPVPADRVLSEPEVGAFSEGGSAW